ncbi:zinc finger C3H1 domain-containing protein [Trichomycterus rosablanca]|uniref:zinc finger C3H1 domain-containing protein n=1 Tax=Trichomycterus rosablanca TaxID=2290929 RepID=UPI002F360A5A
MDVTREETELEDGEICDDEPEVKQRPVGSRRARSCNLRAGHPAVGNPQDYRPSGPPPVPHPLPLPFRPAPDRPDPPALRSGFWERSHRTLTKFRYRDRAPEIRPERARATGRAWSLQQHRHRDPNNAWNKKAAGGRPASRKASHGSSKSESSMDESFEDLLIKYKEIQLELESIRNQERRALKPGQDTPPAECEDMPPAADTQQETEPAQQEVKEQIPEKKVFQSFNIRPLRQKLLLPGQKHALDATPTQEEKKEEESKEAGLDEAEPKEVEQKETDNTPNEPTAPIEAKEEDDELNLKILPSNEKKGKEDDDELSELQLRLLALQSASRRWQQKEQQVMKESKEKLNRTKTPPESSRVTTRSASAGRGRVQEKGKPAGRLGTERAKAAPKGHPAKHSMSPAVKQSWRKQQVHTWKLQQQQQRQKNEEEEEKWKREEEIRKIRDLSNQEEQYNRFMKLVGSKLLSQTRSLDSENRKCVLKQGLDSAGNLYQYDNYDEVAMDTDSEANSPAVSPVHEPFAKEFPVIAAPELLLGPSPFCQDVSQCSLESVGGVCLTPPPPPPPLPPPEESERPPKPPFADEEEEEEMMLREELLKSLASKRAVRVEDTSSNSGPPSPMRPVAPPPAKAPASTVGFGGGASLSRGSSKYSKGAPASRVALVLPRHKAVVVRLNASDDSDSEIEAPSSVQCVFGLESMIKEARRTAEATRPRAVPTAEKENEPLRTPEALPEEKKMEYRLLRMELTSRENQRISKSDAAVSSLDSTVDAAEKPSEVQNNNEDKLTKHRAQLQKDQVVLDQLHQQEIRKKEALKMAEAKVLRLKEQLLAAERVASANRVLLRKLQEQVQRVHHRVAVKQQQVLRIERELLLSQPGVPKNNYKHKNTQQSAGKRRRLDVSDSHYASLMEQKKRLQQLESEYALKIQKLKEAQAQRQATNLTVPCSVTQPSLHDLTQDKLTLTSDDPSDEPEPEGTETHPATTTARRRSFRESGSFTKPNLSHAETPAVPTASPIGPTPAKTSISTAPPAEFVLLGLNLDDLRLRYEKSETFPELLQRELCAVGGALLNIRSSQKVVQVDFDPIAPQRVRSELKPAPFGPYQSPLLVFRSYRFSPYFRTKEKLSLSSVTYSNTVEPRKCFCRFDLTGTCNDDGCQWQHMRNCTLNGNQLFQDILSYSLPLIGCSEDSSTNEIIQATERYIKKLFGGSKDRMGSDQKAVLLVSKVNESLRHIPPYTTYKQRRKWRPEPQRPDPPTTSTPESEEENIAVPIPPSGGGDVSECWSVSDVCITQDDKRYFESETDDISNLEYSVLESPRDRQLWIKLAYRYLQQRDINVSERVDAALNTLSRALEDNRDDDELWCHYLTLFSRRGSTDDVREMCDMAVEHAAHYSVWCTYLNIESTYEGKDRVCERMLQFLNETAGDTVDELNSFRLLETLLYRAQLSVYTGRVSHAQFLLQSALVSEGERGVLGHLTLTHRSLAWLCYIHLCEFKKLPSELSDPANSNPSRMVRVESFLLPWSTSENLHTPSDRLISLFQDALSHCMDECVSPVDRTLACLPLHLNLLHVYRILGRLQEAVAHCETVLSVVPECCPLLEILSELHTAAGDVDEATSVWLRAHKLSPNDARVFYCLLKHLHRQARYDEMGTLFKQFVLLLCDCKQDEHNPQTIIRSMLGLEPENLQQPVRSLSPDLQHQLPYLHLTYSLWQAVRGSVPDAVEAYEAALGAVSDLAVVQKIWLDYLLFTSSTLAGQELRVLSDLVQRCLNTVPARITLPHNSATYWSCFTFHNQVISFYLSSVPPSHHSPVLERFRSTLPTNTELSIKVLQQEWIDGNLENLKQQARLITAAFPNCLSGWRILIAVQKELKSRSEVQKLYQQALQKMPLCAALWKDWLLFEAAAGGKSETLNQLLLKCEASGVSLSEALSVSDPP